MDKNGKKSLKNPRKGANPLSIWTFKWMLGTFLTGYNRELETSDLYSPLDEHCSRLLGDKLSYTWDQELERYQKFQKRPSLRRVLLKCFGCEIMVYGLCIAFIELFLKIVQPIIIVNLLRYFRGNYTKNITEACYYWSLALALVMFLEIFIFHNAFQGLRHIGMKMRVGCCSLVYRKVLKVPNTQGKSNIGLITNLLSTGAIKLDFTVTSAHYVWIAPIQIVLISYLLYKEMGVSIFGGIAIHLLSIPIHGINGKMIHYFTSKISYLTDERLRLTNQIISGVKVIKMYVWEKPFTFLNDKARKKEVKAIRNNTMTIEIYHSCREFVPRVCFCVTILLYILLRNNINTEMVYFLTAYYNVLRNSFYGMLPLGVRDIAQASATLKRLKNFLLSEEIRGNSVNNENTNLKINDKISLSLNNLTAKWNSKLKCDALKQISFQLECGSLTAITGQVGAGKTTLFQAILQEISDVRGKVKVNGKVSYACQEPWLFTSSIKQNILFGKPMDRDRYNKVIEVCQLNQDFLLLPYGENTLVGDRGMNLSGGQCARINLARAVYHEADIYLLDDPLSAVDPKVGKRIFEDCIKTYLKDKTVVLITHQFQYLKQVDRIIILDQGVMLANDTYANLMESGLDLTKIMQIEGESYEISSNDRSAAKVGNETGTVSAIEEEQLEAKSTNRIKSETFLRYFKAAHSSWLVFLVILISVTTQIFNSGADYFITYWVNVEELGGNFTVSSSNDLLRGREWYIYIYSVIIVVSISISILHAYIFCHTCMKISRNLYVEMFTSIIKTKIAFFNWNPIGRIMNRFSEDVGIVDSLIPTTVFDVIKTSCRILAIIVIVVNIYPWLLIESLVIALLAYLLRCFYIKTIRAVKRLDGITRSPMFHHLNTSVRGLTTIRALKAQQILINQFDNYQDLNSSAWFIFISGSRAFGLYIDFLCTIFMGIVIYTLLPLTDTLSIGNVGLAITQCTLLTQIVQLTIREITDLESQMISVERILEYSRLEPEPLLESVPENKVPEKWPQLGQIMFKDVNLIYDRQEKPVLKNLNFTIKPNQMVGIVGRTGAGKSSIITALFRLAELEGEIYIDDVATSKIALQDLRSKISIIPQEPVLFAGTLRKNLDPFEEYTDDAIWQALEDVQLKSFLLQSNLGLNMKVTEGGVNFSVGQRQLLCLARAIVKNNKILVLDEATANVDPQTDQLIQKTVRKKFARCTVLIIAHRLHTVMDSSKILVMDAGKLVEFDHPYNLLQRKGGVFYNMVEQMGPTAAENLFQIAKLNYEKNHKHKPTEI